MGVDVVTTSSSSSDHVVIDPKNESQAVHISKFAYWYPILGLFVFYVGHDALQERMFRFEGFEFGFFMTLVEVLVMLAGSVASERKMNIKSILMWRRNDSTIVATPKDRRTQGRCVNAWLGSSLSTPVLIRITWVGIFLALAHGLGNTALRYSPYPLKVAFKSCKLVPTMALGACVTGRKHTALQYTAALVMGTGLAVLTAADIFNAKKKLKISDGDGGSSADTDGIGPLFGPILLAVSTFFDSVVPNLQEQLLQSAKVKTSQMIFFSNAVMCCVLFFYTLYSGELSSAWIYCTEHKDASSVLLMQGTCAFLGLQCYLAIIRDHGGVAGVLLANARKVLTIILSFLLFAKPFNERHFVGLVLVFVGVYLGYISKKDKKSQDRERLSTKRKKRKDKKKIQNDDHEHNV